MQYKEEIWKDIPGYESFYQASSFGRVRSKDREGQFVLKNQYGSFGLVSRAYKGRVLKQCVGKFIYPMVQLACGTYPITPFLVHRLVAITFIPNPENKPEVNHKNGIRDDNRLSNLEWCTRSENQQHALRTGLRRNFKGSDNINSKLNQKQVDEIRLLKGTLTYRQIGKMYGVCHNTILKIINHRLWKD